MNIYITRYNSNNNNNNNNNNNKKYCTNQTPTRRRYSTIIMRILRPSKNFRKSKYQIHP